MGKGESFLPIFSSSKMTNKVALVTGGSEDIGLMCVKELLGCGAKAIMIADIDEKEGKEVICDLSQEFGENRAAFIKTDVANIMLLRNAFNWTRKHFENIDIVVNIAKQVQTDSWVDQIEKNVKGIVRGTLLGFEYMGIHNGGKGGAILNLITASTLDDGKECPLFTGARHYIIGFGRAMSKQYNKDTAVKVVSLCAVEESFKSGDQAERPTTSSVPVCVICSGTWDSVTQLIIIAIAKGKTARNNGDSGGCDLANLALLAKTGTVWTNV